MEIQNEKMIPNNKIMKVKGEPMIQLNEKTHKQLIDLCKTNKIKKYSGKTKDELIEILTRSLYGENTPKEGMLSMSVETPHYNMVDLFSGTGGFSLAFESTNHIKVVFSNDMINDSKIIYDENFTHKLTLNNINEIENQNIPPHDILTAGFPCQPFSIAGLRLGFEDERSNVFWKILTVIDSHSPKCVILENVKNLLTHDNGKTFETIKTNLEERHYYIHYGILNTSKITGIPQHRERIYIVCIKSKSVFDKFVFDFPTVEKKSLCDFLEKDVPSKYYYNDKSAIWGKLSESVIKKNTVYQYRRVYVRENKRGECPTLTANIGGGGHNVPIIMDDVGIRKLTPRECFNLQGFPMSYKLPTSLCDSRLYKLAGNAVSVPVVKLIADKIVPLLIAE